mmetsp:Transcript_2161/g.5336  ORF Transcript_2161/g.5336 Transcript_2161/m.5336 type:complete len:212 (+) Transcript_2161:912-1547(+)
MRRVGHGERPSIHGLDEGVNESLVVNVRIELPVAVALAEALPLHFCYGIRALKILDAVHERVFALGQEVARSDRRRHQGQRPGLVALDERGQEALVVHVWVVLPVAVALAESDPLLFRHRVSLKTLHAMHEVSLAAGLIGPRLCRQLLVPRRNRLLGPCSQRRLLGPHRGRVLRRLLVGMPHHLWRRRWQRLQFPRRWGRRRWQRIRLRRR